MGRCVCVCVCYVLHGEREGSVSATPPHLLKRKEEKQEPKKSRTMRKESGWTKTGVACARHSVTTTL